MCDVWYAMDVNVYMHELVCIVDSPFVGVDFVGECVVTVCGVLCVMQWCQIKFKKVIFYVLI